MSQTYIPEYEEELLERLREHAKSQKFPQGVKLVREANGKYFLAIQEDGALLSVVRTSQPLQRAAWQWLRGGVSSPDTYRTRKEAAFAGLLALTERVAP